jgi:hypothetical protein
MNNFSPVRTFKDVKFSNKTRFFEIITSFCMLLFVHWRFPLGLRYVRPQQSNLTVFSLPIFWTCIPQTNVRSSLHAILMQTASSRCHLHP